MNEFENIVVGKSAIPSLIITVILMIALPVLFIMYWRINHKQQTKISWLIAGAIGFIVSARVLELGVHYLCIIADNPVSRFINGNTAVFVIYGALMAGVFEECGRYIIMKFIWKKNRSPENAIMYGIGHGGIEVLSVALPLMITYLTIAILFSTGNVDTALSTLKISEEIADTVLPSVQSAASFDYAMMALNVIERIIAMTIHIGFTIIVYYGVLNSNKIFLPTAIILHILVDAFAGLYQKGVVPLWSCEVWFALWTTVTVFIAVKLYRLIPNA